MQCHHCGINGQHSRKQIWGTSILPFWAIYTPECQQKSHFSIHQAILNINILVQNENSTHSVQKLEISIWMCGKSWVEEVFVWTNKGGLWKVEGTWEKVWRCPVCLKFSPFQPISRLVSSLHIEYSLHTPNTDHVHSRREDLLFRM